MQGSALAQACLRGRDARRALITTAGGLLDDSDVAKLFGMTAASVHKRYQAGQLLGIREEKRPIGYPALQFDGPRVVRDLPRVLAALAESETDEWSQLRAARDVTCGRSNLSPRGVQARELTDGFLLR